MKKGLMIILQILTVALGIGVLIFLLWMPQVEGRNVNATLFEIYFRDPFLAYVYIGSIAFFVGLYQVFKALGYARQNKLYSAETPKLLKIVKYCALILIAFTLGGQIYIITSISDDRAGGIMMGNFIIFCSIVVAVSVSLIERRVQKALTV